MSFIQDALEDAHSLLSHLLKDQALQQKLLGAINCFIQSLERGGKILACGNGGSFCDSMHFVEELTGRYRKDRPPLAAISMGDPGHLTCVANDYGFEYVFSRHVEALGRPGDTLLAISTSGNSPNVIKAVEAARQKQMHTVALLGKNGGELLKICSHPLLVPHHVTDRIQEMHIKMIHLFIEGIERHFFADHYAQDKV